MDDRAIIALFFDRSERAVEALAAKYGPLLHRIAQNILLSGEDARECVNDAYLGIWNAIPPQRPEPLCAFVCAVTRNQALKRLRAAGAQKRSGYHRSLEELAEVLPAPGVEEQFSARELGREIDAYLAALSPENRALFLRRYWFGDSVQDLARAFSLSENAVSARLFRLREGLRRHLAEKEVTL